MRRPIPGCMLCNVHASCILYLAINPFRLEKMCAYMYLHVLRVVCRSVQVIQCSCVQHWHHHYHTGITLLIIIHC